MLEMLKDTKSQEKAYQTQLYKIQKRFIKNNLIYSDRNI